MTINRRTFLASTFTSGAMIASGNLPGAAAHAQVRGANDRIRVGVIGTGVRGKYLIGNLPKEAEVIAICDCSEMRMGTTLNPASRFQTVLADFSEHAESRCSTWQDYRKMLDSVSLDAVIIATPDHHHVQAACLALLAGLDVYLEKPLSISISEGRHLVEMVKRTGRVLQVGSQQRTMEVNRFACEFIREGGLGKISRIDFPNYPGPISELDLPEQKIPDTFDWNLFQGPASARPYNSQYWMKEDFKVGNLLWRGWDLFRDYSGHLMTNWGAHSIDMVQYALGMDNSGPKKITPRNDVDSRALEEDWQRKWSEKTPYPNTEWKFAKRFQPTIVEYANGAKIVQSPGVDAAIFHGEKGTMKISRNKYSIDNPDLITQVPDKEAAALWDGKGHVARPHLQNWLDCMRTRKETNAPPEVGHRTVTVCHLMNLARETNRTLHWDPIEEKFEGDQEANRLLERPRRNEFQLPTLPSA